MEQGFNLRWREREREVEEGGERKKMSEVTAPSPRHKSLSDEADVATEGKC